MIMKRAIKYVFLICLFCAGFSINAFAVDKIAPLLDCVDYNAETEEVTAHFGYINANANAVNIPVGADNFFHASLTYQGQPTVFQTGTHHNAFTAIFYLDETSSLTWKLLGIPVTASLDSPRCNLQSQIAELQQQLAAANQTIQSQQTTIGALQSQVTSFSQQVTSLQSQLTAANNQVTELTRLNTELQTAITNLVNAVQQDLRQTFNNPQFTIDGATPTQQLQTLQRALQNLKRSSKQDLYKTLGGR
jgi:hypothetical protein